MKKPYQIESQRAVKQLAEMAADGNPAVQMVLPLAEMIGWLRKGVGELIRQAGLQLMDLMMQEEVRALAGEHNHRQAERAATRWGSERGYCVVMGQKVPIRAAARAKHRRPGSAAGQLRDVSPRRTAHGNGLGEVDARLEHEEIRRSSARVHRSIRLEEERDQRAFHRSEPGQVEGTDGAPAGQDSGYARCSSTRRRSRDNRWWSRWASVKTGAKRSWASGKERLRTQP